MRKEEDNLKEERDFEEGGIRIGEEEEESRLREKRELVEKERKVNRGKKLGKEDTGMFPGNY